MKKKYLSVMALGLCLCFSSCSEDEKGSAGVDDQVGTPALSIESSSKTNEVAQFDTLSLTAATQNMAEGAAYQWTMNGEKVSSESLYKFSQIRAGSYVIELTVTDKAGVTVKSQKTIDVTGKFSEGTFILNEGNMTNETGTLIYVDPKGEAIDSAYYRVNGILLGNVCQDLFIADHKMYIISQNGARNGGEGLLTIANADNLQKIKVYNDPSKTLDWPTHLAVVGHDLYIRDNKGVYLLNETTEALSFIAGTEGAMKNRMAVVGGRVFVMTSAKKILVLKDGAVVHTIVAPSSLSGLVKSYDGQLWASCTSPAQILKINTADFSVMESHDLGEAKIGAGWGAVPAFSAYKDTIYFSNAGLKLYRHLFSENKTEFVANITESVPDALMNYNSLGVNPSTGEVVFATIKGYGLSYKINNIAMFNFAKTPALQYNIQNKNSFPAGVFFTYSFQ